MDRRSSEGVNGTARMHVRRQGVAQTVGHAGDVGTGRGQLPAALPRGQGGDGKEATARALAWGGYWGDGVGAREVGGGAMGGMRLGFDGNRNRSKCDAISNIGVSKKKSQTLEGEESKIYLEPENK